MNRTIEGKSNIKATVICDSVSEAGVRLTTFEIEYPRIILSEFNTHRMLSRNSASSRAIPFEKMLQQLNGKPVRFGAANKGMQDKGEEHDALINDGGSLDTPQDVWFQAKHSSVYYARAFYDAGYHKQVYNRLLEPFQMMKTVVTATEWNNFFWLRDDDAADPTIRELAVCMKQAMAESVPNVLKVGQWHLPYISVAQNPLFPNRLGYYYEDADGVHEVCVEDAIKMSAARAAAVSFRNNDYDLEKCLEVYARLVGSEKKHSSALEHQSTPMMFANAYVEKFYEACDDPQFPSNWEAGITHMTQEGDFFSGNFKGWIQYRKTIKGECKRG